jgi:Domain of unknown function (DUF1877)
LEIIRLEVRRNQFFFGWIGIRYLLPDEVQQVARMLAQTSLETLALRYSPDEMDKLEIYPIGIWQRDGNSGLDYILGYYELLVDFYQKAAFEDKAVLMYIIS